MIFHAQLNFISQADFIDHRFRQADAAGVTNSDELSFHDSDHNVITRGTEIKLEVTLSAAGAIWPTSPSNGNRDARRKLVHLAGATVVPFEFETVGGVVDEREHALLRQAAEYEVRC